MNKYKRHTNWLDKIKYWWPSFVYTLLLHSCIIEWIVVIGGGGGGGGVFITLIT